MRIFTVYFFMFMSFACGKDKADPLTDFELNKNKLCNELFKI